MGSGLACESPVGEVVGYMDSALVGFRRKDTLTDESFSIPRNWLTLEEAVPIGSLSPQMSNHKNTEN